MELPDSVTAVRTYDRAERPKKPFYVEWRTQDGTRKREAFKTASSRDLRATDLKKKIGHEEPPLTRDQIKEYWFLKRLYEQKESATVSSLVVSDASKTYLADAEKRKENGQISPDTLRQKKTKVKVFVDSFGAMKMAEVTKQQIGDWLEALDFDSGYTHNDYLKHVTTFFSFFKEEIPKNPAEHIERLPEGGDEVGILTPAQTKQLFSYAQKHHPEALGRLALEAFAGLRFSSSFRLQKSDINFENKGILLPKRKIKTKRRHYIDKLPDNLWAWLGKTNDACWAMENSEWMHLKSSLFTNSKCPHPHNCLRHSFATYHVAAYKNPGATATLLCHSNQQKLWSHYYGIGTEADGLAYFAILPD